MNNFTKRLLFGGLYVAIVFIATWFNAKLYTLVFGLFMLLSIYEFQKIEKIKSIFPYITALSMTSLIYGLNFHFFDTKFNINSIIAIIILSLFIPFITTLLSENPKNTSILKNEFLTFVYLILPFSFMQIIPFIDGEKYNNQIILGIFILIWINDTFAYLIGKRFGKNKLFKRISPKKTIEGFVGGFVFSLIGAYLLAQFFTSLRLIDWLAIAFIASIFGTIGDLVESMFKRKAAIKDSSNLIPGHGGFLDRLDSVIFATPFIFVYLILFT